MRAMAAARRTGRVVAALLLAIALAGCVKLDVDLTVASDDTVDGTVVIAADKKALQAAGQDPDTLYATLAASLPSGAGITKQKYDDDGFAGVQLTMTDVPMAGLPDLGPAGRLQLSRSGDEYQFDAVLNLGTDATTGISIPEGLTTKPELRVSVTFPGEVTATNGEKDGTTARWTPTLGQQNELTATALATGGAAAGGDSSSGGLILVAVIGGLAVTGAAAALFLTRRRELSRPVPLTPLPSDTEPPPPLSSLTRRDRPLPRPLPPPEPPK
jgi:LppM domain